MTDVRETPASASAVSAAEPAANPPVEAIPSEKMPAPKQHWSLLGSLLFALTVAVGLFLALRVPESPRSMRLPEPAPRPALLDAPPMSPQPSRVLAPARRN